jgi:hypothetical protein
VKPIGEIISTIMSSRDETVLPQDGCEPIGFGDKTYIVGAIRHHSADKIP